MIVTVLTHWRPQELIELITVQREGEQEHISVKTKRKIKERITERKKDIKLNKKTTALAKLNRNKDIKIDFIQIKSVSNNENHTHLKKKIENNST